MMKPPNLTNATLLQALGIPNVSTIDFNPGFVGVTSRLRHLVQCVTVPENLAGSVVGQHGYLLRISFPEPTSTN